MGVMVWQDFAMACATYPTDGEFQAVMRGEATQIVRSLRQHPSIILWAGDNECDAMIPSADGVKRNPNNNRITREVLPDVVAFEDPARPYLPSSPYVDEDANKLPHVFLPENHLWGPRDYFKSDFYKSSLCNFASEIGYHGCPSVESMKKFLSPEALWPWQGNGEWQTHAASPEIGEDGIYNYRIELMAKQIYELFGVIPGELDDYVLASQISQAEAKKFFIELFRTGQPKRSGIIWWNLIDGWPQFSDAVVDYFYCKKLAYHYIKQSQQPLLLTFTEPRDWRLRLAAANNSGKTLDFAYTVTDYEASETVLTGADSCSDGQVYELGSLPYSQGEKKIYVINWECEGCSGRNHYLSGNPPFELDRYRAFLSDVYRDLIP
jgi:beta-mannosidase